MLVIDGRKRGDSPTSSLLADLLQLLDLLLLRRVVGHRDLVEGVEGTLLEVLVLQVGFGISQELETG